ncbi:hypothetical protein [Emticicia fontis]
MGSIDLHSFISDITENVSETLIINERKSESIRNPSINVHFFQNGIYPADLGEPTFPHVFGAFANAFYKNTGKRHYNHPSKSDLLKS